MNDFWCKLIAVISIILVLIIILHYILSLEWANAITLTALLFTIVSVFYSNYKSDDRLNKQLELSEEQFKKQLEQNEKNLKEQLLFDKKQNIYIKLYKNLNDHWELLDKERVEYYLNNYSDYEPFRFISYETFSEIHMIMQNFYLSPDFLYTPLEIQNITEKFLKYVDNFLDHYDYYKIDDNKNYYDATDILSEIFPILKREIGLT